MQSQVYIPQVPRRFDAQQGAWVDMDLSPALDYGTPRVLLALGPDDSLSAAPMVRHLKERLREFCDQDYLIPVGSPAVFAAAAIIAANFNQGRVNLLCWDRRRKQYDELLLETRKEKL